MSKAKVYFSNEISSESILNLYQELGYELKGNVAVKVHSGEVGNQNFLGPDMFKDIMDYVKGTIVECNTAYDGERNTSEKHLKTLTLFASQSACAFVSPFSAPNKIKYPCPIELNNSFSMVTEALSTL